MAEGNMVGKWRDVLPALWQHWDRAGSKAWKGLSLRPQPKAKATSPGLWAMRVYCSHRRNHLSSVLLVCLVWGQGRGWAGAEQVLIVSLSFSAGSLPFHMDSVIHVLEAVEPDLGGHINLTVPDLARGLGCCDSDLEQLLLGAAPAMPLDLPSLTQERRAFLSSLLVPPAPALALASSVQHGVVLVPDGTTVALSPLLAGIDAGLKRRREMPLPPTALGSGPGVDLSHASSGPELPRTIDALYAVTIAKALGLAFLLTRHNKSKAAMGPDGCWDNVAEPQNFTLLGSPSALPDAIINGALDGVVLGAWLAERTEPPAPVSTLLREYYAAGDLTGPGQARSNFRRQNFAALSPTKALTGQVASALLLLQTLPQTQALFQGVGTEELLGLAHKAAQEFTVTYLGR